MPRFMVVDDDELAARGLSRLLTGDGHDVASFTTGAEAVAALARQPFDVVVTDLEMPRVDGLAVVGAVRAHQPATCVVVATARAAESRRRLVSAGACMVSDKPMDYDGMIRDIEACRARGGGALGCPLKRSK